MSVCCCCVLSLLFPLLQRGAVKVFARRTVKGGSSGSSSASPWYGPGECLGMLGAHAAAAVVGRCFSELQSCFNHQFVDLI
jgi:hypothetical protein